jgi:transaldolase
VHPLATVALAATRAGLAAATALVAEGRSVLVTGVHRPGQLLAALGTGCRWVAPYVGAAVPPGAPPVPVQGHDPLAEALCMQEVLQAAAENEHTGLLAAGVVDEAALVRLAVAGVAAATVVPEVAAALLDDERTTAGLEEPELGLT